MKHSYYCLNTITASVPVQIFFRMRGTSSFYFHLHRASFLSEFITKVNLPLHTFTQSYKDDMESVAINDEK